MPKAVVVFGVLLLSLLVLNYSGFCYSQKRWLSDDELIHAAVDAANAPATLVSRANDVQYTRVPYANAEELLQANPGCCRVEHTSQHDGLWQFVPTIAKSIGIGGTLVTIQFTDRYIDETGVQRTNTITRQYVVANCGVVN